MVFIRLWVCLLRCRVLSDARFHRPSEGPLRAEHHKEYPYELANRRRWGSSFVVYDCMGSLADMGCQ
jgi:hypothetical protein